MERLGWRCIRCVVSLQRVVLHEVLQLLLNFLLGPSSIANIFPEALPEQPVSLRQGYRFSHKGGGSGWM